MVLRAEIKACSSLGVGGGRGRKGERRVEREGRMKMRMRMRLCVNKKKNDFGQRDGKKKRKKYVFFRANGTELGFSRLDQVEKQICLKS